MLRNCIVNVSGGRFLFLCSSELNGKFEDNFKKSRIDNSWKSREYYGKRQRGGLWCSNIGFLVENRFIRAQLIKFARVTSNFIKFIRFHS